MGDPRRKRGGGGGDGGRRRKGGTRIRGGKGRDGESEGGRRGRGRGKITMRGRHASKTSEMKPPQLISSS